MQESKDQVSSQLPQYYKNKLNNNNELFGQSSSNNEKMIKNCTCIWVNPNLNDLDDNYPFMELMKGNGFHVVPIIEKEDFKKHLDN